MKQIYWICTDCGEKYGIVDEGHLCTFHYNTCDACGEYKVVTQGSDYRVYSIPDESTDLEKQYQKLRDEGYTHQEARRIILELHIQPKTMTNQPKVPLPRVKVRGKKVLRKCKSCNFEFEAREADIKRGWAKYCSKSCKAVHQEKKTGQYGKYLENRFKN